MDSKLTLKLDDEIIRKAKLYAADRKVSLSRLIENYLNSLTTEKYSSSDIEISPFVKSLSTKVDISTDFDYKTEHGNYLEEKHR